MGDIISLVGGHCMVPLVAASVCSALLSCLFQSANMSRFRLQVVTTLLLAIVSQRACVVAFTVSPSSPSTLQSVLSTRATLIQPASRTHHVHPSRSAITTSTARVYASSDDDDAQQPQLLQKGMSTGYQVTCLAYAAYALQNLRIHKSLPYAVWVASGHALAAGVAYLLSRAASNDALFLFTSKRYNLGLAVYGMCQVLCVVLAGRVPGGLALVVGPILATVLGLQGYNLGVRGWKSQKPVSVLLQDGSNMARQFFSSLVNEAPKTLNKSAGYWVATLFLSTLTLGKIKDVATVIFSADQRSNLLVPVARLGRFAFWTIVASTLQTLTSKGMDGGKDYAVLNFLSSISFGALAIQAGSSNAILGIASSLLCAWNGVVWVLAKTSSR